MTVSRKYARRLALRVVDQLNADATKWGLAVRKKHTISCKRGCAHCCNLMPTVSILEALAILEELGDMWTFDGVRCEALRYLGLLELSLENSTVWWEEQNGCMFLDSETLDCTIYETRPLTCRTHVVISPPDDCSTFGGRALRINDQLFNRHAFSVEGPMIPMLRVEDEALIFPLPLALLAAEAWIAGAEEYAEFLRVNDGTIRRWIESKDAELERMDA